MGKLPFEIVRIEYVGLDHFGKCGSGCPHQNPDMYKLHCVEDEFRFQIMCETGKGIRTSKRDHWLNNMYNYRAFVTSIRAVVKDEVSRITGMFNKGYSVEWANSHWDGIEEAALQEGKGILCAIQRERATFRE